MKNYIQPGQSLTLTAPAGGVTSGQPYLIGSLFVVATGSAAAGSPFVGARCGVFELTKTAGQAWTEGAALYWDNAARACTTVSTSNTRIGWAAQAATSAATTGAVLLSGLAS
ncbi:DUF2190 family protein [Archangium violaceum]|uniref:DUF2190 family protein n=1 Tax=Archangium violaceum TaxID=83451 RepID=UPI002B31FE5B|nr:DUF2190 family protein [Archangium violaceum]